MANTLPSRRTATRSHRRRPLAVVASSRSDNVGLQYETVDLTHDQAAADLVTQLGYRSAPVVIVGTEHWAGFRPDKINAIAAAQAATLTPILKEEKE